MKKTHLFVVFVFLGIQTLFSQLKNIKFDDGTKMEYEVLERNTDKARRGNIRLGIGTVGLGYEYVDPKKFEAQINFGLDGVFTVSGLVGLGAKEKAKNYNLQLSSKSGGNTTTIYLAKNEEVMDSKMPGLHLGVKYFLPFVYNQSLGLMGGFGYIRTRHAKYFVDNKSLGKNYKMSFTSRSGVYIDAVYFPMYKAMVSDQTTGTSAIGTPSDYRKMGVVLCYQGTMMVSRKGKKEKGSTWEIGGGVTPSGALIIIGGGFAF